MIRILVYFALVFAVAVGAAWLADRPGTVTIDWQGWRLDTSVMVAVVALLALLAATLVVWAVLRGLIRAPVVFGRFMGRRRQEKGRTALSRGLVAVGAGDAKLARRYMTEARRLLPQDPATRFLEAQTAQLNGDNAAARIAFEGMLDDPETRALGLHGLYVEAVRAGEHDAAYHYAEQAAAVAPGLPWAGRARFEHAAAVRDWEGAIAILDKNAHNGLVDKPSAKRLKAVLLTARALELESAAPERARALALEAHGLAADLVPAAAVAGRVLARLNDPRRATKVVEATWRKAPHPDLVEAFALIRPGEAGRDRLKRMRGLAALKPGDIEGRLAVARAAVDARDFPAARDELKAVLAERPSQRACLLMADLEEAEHGDRGRVREWLARAVRAPRDPVWTADGITSEHWSPVSPTSGRLDAFEWKVPVEAIGSTAGPLVDEALFAPPPEEPATVIDATVVPPAGPAEAPSAGRMSAPPAAADATMNKAPQPAAASPTPSMWGRADVAGAAAVPSSTTGAATAAPAASLPPPTPPQTPAPAKAAKPFWARRRSDGPAVAEPAAKTAAAEPPKAPVAAKPPEATPAKAPPAAEPAKAAAAPPPPKAAAEPKPAAAPAGATAGSAAPAAAAVAAPMPAAAATPAAADAAKPKEVLVMPSSVDGAPPKQPADKPFWARDAQDAPTAPSAAPAPSASPSAAGPDGRRTPRLVEFPLAHSPDDPGPAEGGEETGEARPRQKLF